MSAGLIILILVALALVLAAVIGLQAEQKHDLQQRLTTAEQTAATYKTQRDRAWRDLGDLLAAQQHVATVHELRPGGGVG